MSEPIDEVQEIEWMNLMQCRYDAMPAWWWDRAERRKEFLAWMAARRSSAPKTVEGFA